MTTNDQPHAEVTEEIRNLRDKLFAQFAYQQRHFQAYDPIALADQILADFVAKREAAACQRMDVEELQPCMKRVDELHARESLLTASNEDLAAQVVKLTEKNTTLQELGGALDQESKGWQERAEKAELALKRAQGSDQINKTGSEIIGERYDDLQQLATRLSEVVDFANKFCDIPYTHVVQINEVLADARKANLLK